jgi:hypothetical protein
MHCVGKVCRSAARFSSLVAAALLLGAGALPPAAHAASDLVISQVYGGGGNAGAPFHNDYIEVFNRGSVAVDVTGWSVQYAPATSATWSATALSGVIPAGGYYLVQEIAGAGGGAILPTPDAVGGISMNATMGKVALVSSITIQAGTCPTGGDIVDMVGYGAANCSETSPTGSLSNTNAGLRNLEGCEDTDNNLADFTVAAPFPRNSAFALHSCQHVLGITVDPSGSGTVVKAPDLASYTHGSSVQLTATPTLGYHFVNWTGDVTGSANPVSLLMDDDKAVTARFATNGPSGLVVISQIYGGGGNTGAQYHNDYFELYNRGNIDVDVTGWSVQYAANTGDTWFSTTLIGVIAPGKYFLVEEREGAGGGAGLPAPDAIGDIPVSSIAGKVALVNNTVLLTTGCPSGGSVMDFVGYGATDCSETSPCGVLDNLTAAFRNNDGCDDTENNQLDFSSAAAAPRNSSTPFNLCAVWVEVGDDRVGEFALENAAPNPASGTLRISYALAREARIRLEVLDVQGRVVATLADGTFSSGRHEATWSGAANGGMARSGMYFVRLLVPGKSFVRRVALTR